jgi:predicted Zn-dependent protease
MDQDPVTESERLFARAVCELAEGKSQSALADLERALKLHDNPSWYSYLGYCIAKERGQVRKGGELCNESLAAEPEVPAHYLNLAKIHLACGHKAEAIEVLRTGATVTGCPEILAQMNLLGSRKSPVLSFLSRQHWVNRYLGLVLSRLGLR